MNETSFLAINSSGRSINILNDETTLPTTKTTNNKRKYHCTEPGCEKSFTTSGHLARHHRIHTGEKNFPCFYPGCLSRFSRQDNMMQHYRTHMSNNPRRIPKKGLEDFHLKPKLHAHQRIRSDPYHIERPLTIDQHLDKYYQQQQHYISIDKHRMPPPLGAVALQKQHTTPTIDLPKEPILFYQHKPLLFREQTSLVFPSTLLHPKHHIDHTNSLSLSPTNTTTSTTTTTSSSSSSSSSSSIASPLTDTHTDEPDTKTSLLQLAHIVSTFG